MDENRHDPKKGSGPLKSRVLTPFSEKLLFRGLNTMVERKIELRRRRTRHKKLLKLKDKLSHAKEGKEKDGILAKIHIVSPWWQEPVK